MRRLASIENFGSMDVLCSDKTGTLTEGAVRARRRRWTLDGRPSERVLRLRLPQRRASRPASPTPSTRRSAPAEPVDVAA